MTATSDARTTAVPGKSPVARRPKKARAKKKGHLATQIFLAVVAVLWIFPVRLRPHQQLPRLRLHGDRTATCRSAGSPSHNYKNAWEQANFSHTMLNSAIITVPAVLLTLFLSLLRRLRRGALLVQVQPRPARLLHGGEPAAAAGAAHPGLPDVPGHRGARSGSASRAPCSTASGA